MLEEEEERDRRSPERHKVSHHRRNNSLEEQMGVLEDTQDVRGASTRAADRGWEGAGRASHVVSRGVCCCRAESIRGIRQLQESVDEVLRDTQGLLDMINLENGD